MSSKEPKSTQQDQIKLSRIPATVVRVHFDGVRRTSRDVLKKQVNHLFSTNVSDFQSMLEAIEVARERLKQLGIFKKLKLIIDSPPRDHPDMYDVIFEVEEHKRWRMGFSVLSSLDNKASVVSRGTVTNLAGGGELLEVDWHVGVNQFAEQQRHLTFVKPLEDAPSVKFMAGVFDSATGMSWVKMNERVRGCFVGVHWPTFAGVHALRLDGQWRHLAAEKGALGLPLLLREESGHFLRCALRHDFRADGRDDPILPSYGGLAKVRHELAMGGAGQDQAHLLHDVELQWNLPIIDNPITGTCVSMQLTQSWGHIRSISANQHVSVSDRLFLGGPLSLRGYEMRQAGPRIDTAEPQATKDFPHGGKLFALSGLHLYSTLPFLGARDFFRNIRMHAFANAGTLNTRQVNWRDPARLGRLLADQMRLSCGLGVVVRLFGIARFEVNYCWPMWYQSTDKIVSGLQCGIGVEYQ